MESDEHAEFVQDKRNAGVRQAADWYSKMDRKSSVELLILQQVVRDWVDADFMAACWALS